MTPGKIAELIEVLRASGVEYFKSADLEIRFGSATQPNHVRKSESPVSTKPAAARKSPSAAAAPPVQMEIPHHENEVASLLKMNHEDLLDRMFPDHTPEYKSAKAAAMGVIENADQDAH